MSRQLSFTDYEGFVEKFKPKKTTDDCYTPPAVYDAVLEYVDRNVTPLEGREVVRPFWPGGDYERHEAPFGGGFMVTSQVAVELERGRDRDRERERLTERRPMSPAFHEMLRRLNASAPPFHIDP